MSKASPEDAGNFKAGYVAIIGRPNVGKSTLMNRMVGQDLCIVSPRPQTTWHRILGIKNLPAAQILFVDTPGIHRSDALFNRNLVHAAERAMADADAVLWLIDATQTDHPDDQLILQKLQQERPKAPVFLAVNKVDLIAKPLLLPLIAHWQTLYGFNEIVPISAAKGVNLDRLEALLVASLPTGHAFYPPEDLTDRNERFFIAEILRGGPSPSSTRNSPTPWRWKSKPSGHGRGRISPTSRRRSAWKRNLRRGSSSDAADRC